MSQAKRSPAHAFRSGEVFMNYNYISNGKENLFKFNPLNMTEDRIIMLYRELLYNSRIGLINQNELVEKLESILQENPKTIQF